MQGPGIGAPCPERQGHRHELAEQEQAQAAQPSPQTFGLSWEEPMDPGLKPPGILLWTATRNWVTGGGHSRCQ